MADAPRVLAATWIPLTRAVLCLSCEALFALDGGLMNCPGCGSECWMPLEMWIGRTEEVSR